MQMNEFLSENPNLNQPPTDSDRSEFIGRHVGPYRIAREIGRGGMGTVYEALRADGEFQHRVAIKLVKSGLDTDSVLKRFRNERQILAQLDHSNIGRLLGGGTTEDGNPYFVMEYIEGQPLFQYCDAQNLNVHDRLRLFTQICDAVHYAHQKLVIHRDLKPTNILVSTTGSPKLLDFGIAKLLDPDLVSDTTPQTTLGVRLMTIEFASPEQVQALPVTYLSDIYSLGVILYELLTGDSPYRFRNRMSHEIARAIIEDEPDLPSVAVARPIPFPSAAYVDHEAETISGETETSIVTLDTVRRELSGDLDNIVLKALRKEPSQRYESVAAFRDDILRHLNGWPVMAPAYPRARKSDSDVKSIAILPLKILKLGPAMDTAESFLGVGLADAMITRLSGVRSLAVRPTSAIVPYGDENNDPFHAGRELNVDYVLDGRIKTLGNRVRVTLQLLDIHQGANAWADQFDEQFSDALDLEDSISARVAESLLPQLTDTGRRKFRKRGTDNPRAFEAYLRGRFFWNTFTPESLPKALASFKEAIDWDPNYALAHVGLADFYNWANIYGILPASQSNALAKLAAEWAIKLDDSLGEAYASRAFIEGTEWNWAECERLYQYSLELNPNYSLAHEWYSSLLIGTGRFEEGLKEIRRAEEFDPLSQRALTLTAWSFYQVRRFDDAIAKARLIIDLDRNNPQGHLQLGNALSQAGKADEALAALSESVRLMPDSALPKYCLCFALVAANRRDEAQEVLNEMLKMAAQSYVKEYFLAMAHLALGNHEAAFEYLEKAFAERDPWLTWFGTEPKLDPLRRNPRFIRLFRQTNSPLAIQAD